MIDPPARFGVCTLRVEVQPEHLLITLTTSRFLAPGARRGLPVRSRSFASVREALEATEQFLDSFGTWNEPASPIR
jgi:hypothetical protein